MANFKRNSKTAPPHEVVYGPPGEPAEGDKELSDLRKIFADLKNRHQRAFLAGFIRAKGVRQAARLSGVCRNAHYKWMQEDDEYRERFNRARTILADEAEAEVFRRAFHGFLTPIIYRGKIRGWYKSHSDMLAMFALRGLKWKVYGANAQSLFGEPGPTSMRITVVEPGKPERPLFEDLPRISIPRNDPEK